jgi:hypothetical protein
MFGDTMNVRAFNAPNRRPSAMLATLRTRLVGVIDPHTAQPGQDSEGICEHPNRSS